MEEIDVILSDLSDFTPYEDMAEAVGLWKSFEPRVNTLLRLVTMIEDEKFRHENILRGFLNFLRNKSYVIDYADGTIDLEAVVNAVRDIRYDKLRAVAATFKQKHRVNIPPRLQVDAGDKAGTSPGPVVLAPVKNLDSELSELNELIRYEFDRECKNLLLVIHREDFLERRERIARGEEIDQEPAMDDSLDDFSWEVTPEMHESMLWSRKKERETELRSRTKPLISSFETEQLNRTANGFLDGCNRGLDKALVKQYRKYRKVLGSSVFYEMAEKGDASYQRMFGLKCYYLGLYREAFTYMKRASSQGDADAMNKIGCFYYNGHGVRQNRRKAFEYFTKAAAAGNTTSRENLDRLYKET